MSNEVKRYKTVIRPATMEDCLDLAPKLRQEDKDEVWESGEALPEEALIISFNMSDRPMVGIINDEVVCMFGVAKSALPNCGIPWLLGTDGIKQFSKEFLAANKAALDEISKEYSILSNYVWSKNTVHIKWLKWLGFTVTKTPIGLGRNQEHFYQFYMHKRNKYV